MARTQEEREKLEKQAQEFQKNLKIDTYLNYAAAARAYNETDQVGNTEGLKFGELGKRAAFVLYQKGKKGKEADEIEESELRSSSPDGDAMNGNVSPQRLAKMGYNILADSLKGQTLDYIFKLVDYKGDTSKAKSDEGDEIYLGQIEKNKELYGTLMSLAIRKLTDDRLMEQMKEILSSERKKGVEGLEKILSK